MPELSALSDTASKKKWNNLPMVGLVFCVLFSAISLQSKYKSSQFCAPRSNQKAAAMRSMAAVKDPQVSMLGR